MKKMLENIKYNKLQLHMKCQLLRYWTWDTHSKVILPSVIFIQNWQLLQNTTELVFWSTYDIDLDTDHWSKKTHRDKRIKFYKLIPIPVLLYGSDICCKTSQQNTGIGNETSQICERLHVAQELAMLLYGRN